MLNLLNRQKALHLLLLILFSLSIAQVFADSRNKYSTQFSDIECHKIKQFLFQQGWHAKMSGQGELQLWQEKPATDKTNASGFDSLRAALEAHGWQVQQSKTGDLLLWPAEMEIDTVLVASEPQQKIRITAPRKAFKKPNTVVKPEPLPIVASMPDTDKDQVLDNMDLCANTKKGIVVNKLGCESGKAIILIGINFRSGSAELTDKAKPILGQQAKKLLKHPNLKFKIVGHTDSTGSQKLNDSLSKQRAITVAKYLTTKKIGSGNIVTVGRGEAEPVATNATAAGRTINRRVELQPEE